MRLGYLWNRDPCSAKNTPHFKWGGVFFATRQDFYLNDIGSAGPLFLLREGNTLGALLYILIVNQRKRRQSHAEWVSTIRNLRPCPGPWNLNNSDFSGGISLIPHCIPAHRMRMGLYETKVRSVSYESRHFEATEICGKHPAENLQNSGMKVVPSS